MFSKNEFVGKALLTELIGTFLLVFIGGIVLTQWTTSVQSLIAAALIYGALLAIINYSMNCHGGTHLNPLVSLGFATAGRMNWKLAIAYIIVQLIAALLAVYLILWFVPGSYDSYRSFGCGENTLASVWKAIVLSTLITLFFVTVFLFVTKQPFVAAASGLAIGVALSIAIFAGQNYVGDFINPARSLSASFVSGNWSSYWIVIVGPIIGAVLAGLLCRLYMHRFNRKELKDECGEQVYDDCGEKMYKVTDCEYDRCGNEVKDECGKKKVIERLEHGNPKPHHMQATVFSSAGTWLERHGMSPLYVGSKASKAVELKQKTTEMVKEKMHDMADKGISITARRE